MSVYYSKEQILTFLKENPIMSAAITGPDAPIATILLFTIKEDFTIYFSTNENTHKAKALQKNPLMSMTVWKHNAMLIQATGRTTIIEDATLKDEVISGLTTSTGNLVDFWPPLLRIRNNSPLLIFEFKLSWLRALDLKSNTITSKEAPFTELTF